MKPIRPLFALWLGAVFSVTAHSEAGRRLDKFKCTDQGYPEGRVDSLLDALKTGPVRECLPNGSIGYWYNLRDAVMYYDVTNCASQQRVCAFSHGYDQDAIAALAVELKGKGPISYGACSPDSRCSAQGLSKKLPGQPVSGCKPGFSMSPSRVEEGRLLVALFDEGTGRFTPLCNRTSGLGKWLNGNQCLGTAEGFEVVAIIHSKQPLSPAERLANVRSCFRPNPPSSGLLETKLKNVEMLFRPGSPKPVDYRSTGKCLKSSAYGMVVGIGLDEAQDFITDQTGCPSMTIAYVNWCMGAYVNINEATQALDQQKRLVNDFCKKKGMEAPYKSSYQRRNEDPSWMPKWLGDMLYRSQPYTGGPI